MKANSFIGLSFFLFVTVLSAAEEASGCFFKKFEIVIPSYNNAEWAERNLMSVCFQNYPRDKYHITYINDASTDGTGKIVADFIARYGLEKHVTLINNPVRKRQLENRYRAFHNIPDDTIIAECDGDDFYADDNVLAELNAIYQNPKMWLLYGIVHRVFPGNKISKAEPFSDDEIMYHAYRDFLNKPTWPVRSYYAWLFKQIKLKDLLYEGKFYPVLTDPAYMIPMLEMAGEHFQYLRKIMYIRNRGNPLAAIKTWDKEFRKKVYDYLSSQEPYDTIEKPEDVIGQKNRSFPIEVCICCASEAAAVKMLALVYEKFSGIDHCNVILESSERLCATFALEKDASFDVTFKLYDPAHISFHKILTRYLERTSSKYLVLFVDEKVALHNKIDLQKCASVLESCCAKVFYLGSCLSAPAEQSPCVEVKHHVWAHQFKYQQMLGKNNFLFNAMVLSKEFLLWLIKRLNFTTVQEFKDVALVDKFPPDEVGLIFDNQCVD